MAQIFQQPNILFSLNAKIKLYDKDHSVNKNVFLISHTSHNFGKLPWGGVEEKMETRKIG